MSRHGEKLSDFEISEQFKCALTRNGRKRRGKLSWLSQGTVTLTKHGGNEIELDVEKAKTNHPYKLSAQNLCGLETGRILVPSNKPFCCQRGSRKESHYVLVAMDDNCGDHPIILLTNPDSNIINHWKWHLQNTLAFVNSWPNLELTYIRDEHVASHRVTLMLTKIWLSVFKFQRFKLPQLWHRIRIANIHDMFYESDTSPSNGKKQLNIICYKGVLRIISSRNEEIFTNIDALWRVPLENPRGLSHPSAPAVPLGDASDTSSIHPRSDHTAPGGNSSDSMLSGKTENNSGSGNSGHSHGPGCAIHQPLILDLMEKPESSSRISVSCSGCLQSGNFNTEDEVEEKPPQPCVGKMPIGDYIDRPRYLPMDGIRRASQVSIPEIGALNVQNQKPAHTPDSGIVTPGREEPSFSTSPLNYAQLETIQSEPEDVTSMELSMFDGTKEQAVEPAMQTAIIDVESRKTEGEFSSLDDPYDMSRGDDGLKMQEGQRQDASLNEDVEIKPRHVNHTQITQGLSDRERSYSENTESIHVIFPLYAQSTKFSRSDQSIVNHPEPPQKQDQVPLSCSVASRSLSMQDLAKANKKQKAAPQHSSSLPRGCRPFGSHYYSIFNFSVPDKRFYDMNLLGQEMKLFERGDAERVVKLMSHSLVTKAQFPSGRSHYISMGTDYIPADQNECKRGLTDESGSDHSDCQATPILRPNRNPRRCNSLGNPWRSRPTSSLYIYWSATNIVHTLHRCQRGKPPRDTLGLSTIERKELCMRLYTSSVDHGQHDWRALAERIGLAVDAVWLIDNFQQNTFSKNTAGEIVLKHWQFCYNNYGVHEEKCPVACTRLELIRLLTDMDRYDLINDVLGKRQILHEFTPKMPQENTSASGAKENTWFLSSDSIGQGHVNTAFSLDESFENIDGITAPRHVASLDLRGTGNESEIETDSEMFNSCELSVSPTSDGYFSYSSQMSPISTKTPKNQSAETVPMRAIPEASSEVAPYMQQTPEAQTMPNSETLLQPERKGVQTLHSAVNIKQESVSDLRSVPTMKQTPASIDKPPSPSAVLDTTPFGGARPKINMNSFPGKTDGNPPPRPVSLLDDIMASFPAATNQDSESSTDLHMPSKQSDKPASEIDDSPRMSQQRLTDEKSDSGNLAQYPVSSQRGAIPARHQHMNVSSKTNSELKHTKFQNEVLFVAAPKHVTTATNSGTTTNSGIKSTSHSTTQSVHVSKVSVPNRQELGQRERQVDKTERSPMKVHQSHQPNEKTRKHATKNELITEIMMREKSEKTDSLRRRKKRISSDYITKPYSLPSESRPTSALHMSVPVSITLDATVTESEDFASGDSDLPNKESKVKAQTHEKEVVNAHAQQSALAQGKLLLSDAIKTETDATTWL